MTNIENLKYFFGAYRGICILTIYGIASVKSLGAMTEILEKLSKEKSKKYLIDFNNTDTTDESIILILINFKNIIKEKKAKFRFCGFSRQLKHKLIDEGVLEENEYVTRQMDAFNELAK